MLEGKPMQHAAWRTRRILQNELACRRPKGRGRGQISPNKRAFPVCVGEIEVSLANYDSVLFSISAIANPSEFGEAHNVYS